MLKCVLMILMLLVLTTLLLFWNINTDESANMSDFQRSVSNYERIWNEYGTFVLNTKRLADLRNFHGVLEALGGAKILKADIYSKGTQLKLHLDLEGNQSAIFKPKWYKIDEVIEGDVFSGKDRFNAEILAFHLSLILEKCLVPPATVRILKMSRDILPVATDRLKKTIYQIKSDRYCVFGQCFYCRRNESVCETNRFGIKGAVILELKHRFQKFQSPWQRTYKKHSKAQWQLDDQYCNQLKNELPLNRLLDLIDVSIFDYLLQNGDRHHYEVFLDQIIYFDNGKGLRNPKKDFRDILAPLYQCCWIRTKTKETLQKLSNNTLKRTLEGIEVIRNVVSSDHIAAVQQRLEIVLLTLRDCKLLKCF